MNEVVNINNEKEEIENTEVRKKKRGRKPKNTKTVYELNKDQTKFFVDLTKDKENLEMIFNLLETANKKEYGREILFKDIALYGISRITNKDIEKIQELSLSEMEKVERSLDEYNKKNGTKLTLGEYLVKKLSI